MEKKKKIVPVENTLDIVEAIHAEEKLFFQRVFTENKIETILDCGCGTGEYLYLLHKLNRKVCGCDSSETLLRIAEANFIEQGVKIPLAYCDLRKVSDLFQSQFDAITCLNNKLPHIETYKELLKAFKSMYRCLNPGGMIILSSATTYGAVMRIPYSQTVIEQDGFKRVMVKETQDKLLIFHVIDSNGTEKEEHETLAVRYRILMDDDYLELLEEAGFKQIRIYEDYSFSPFIREESAKIVVTAKK